ncbi:MAG: cellulose binding domain-containing protein [Sulfurovum sp.]|nr:cellulose binding domain-containing protein [Sulfurovum sp.]
MNRLQRTTLTLCMLLGTGSLSAIEVEVEKTHDWGSGFCADVIVSNTSQTDEMWDIEFYPDGVISSLWNANYTQDDTSLMVQATGVSWNNVVDANDTRSFGYCADYKRPNLHDLKVNQTKEDVWDGGFCSRVEVQNLTSHRINWEIDFPVEGTIFTLWNAKYEQNTTTLSTFAKGVYSNDIIDGNDSISFGYCADEIEEEEEVIILISLDELEDILYDELDAFVLAILMPLM